MTLLEHVLGETEYRSLMRNGWIDIPSRKYKHRFFRIFRQINGVHVFDEGINTSHLCIFMAPHWGDSFPMEDAVIGLYLIAKYDELRLYAIGVATRIT